MRSIGYLLISLIILACAKESDKSTATSPENNKLNDTSKQSDQYVYFANLEEGDIVKSPIKIEMGVEGMTIEPAGPINQNKGHHHLLIDTTYYEAGTIIPSTETTIHFGKGQIETEITLNPGNHSLTLQFADGVHRSYGQKMSKTIEITVE